MRIHNLVKILVFFTAWKTPFFAQQSYNNLNFESLTEEISTRAISTIIKDHKGVIWIGTQGDGLSSYNGYEFKNYRHEWDNSVSINHSIVNTIYMDYKNNLWVGTEEGLNLYNRNLDQFIQVSLDNVNSKIKVNSHKIRLNNDNYQKIVKKYGPPNYFINASYPKTKNWVKNSYKH